MSKYGLSISDETIMKKNMTQEFLNCLQKCTLRKSNLFEKVSYDEYDNIYELFLHDCNFESFPDDITYILSKLSKLWLSQNKLTKLPSNMKYLKSVRSIWLNQNLFEEIPNLPLNFI